MYIVHFSKHVPPYLIHKPFGVYSANMSGEGQALSAWMEYIEWPRVGTKYTKQFPPYLETPDNCQCQLWLISNLPDQWEEIVWCKIQRLAPHNTLWQWDIWHQICLTFLHCVSTLFTVLCEIYDIELKSGRAPSGKSDDTAFWAVTN